MSTYQNWVYTRNPFINATKGSLQKLYVIVSDHDSKLKRGNTDPEIDMLYQRFAPISEQVIALYDNWRNNEAMGRTATLKLDNLLFELSNVRIDDWDVRIRFVFDKRHDNYKTLMGDGRMIFMRGKKDIRIALVRQLAQRLGNFPQLSSLQTDVEAFATLLETTRDDQRGYLKDRRDALESLRQIRVEACKELFKNLSYLNYLYVEQPQRVTDFFKMELVRVVSTYTSNSVEEEDISENLNEEPDSFEELFDQEFEIDTSNTGGDG